MNKYFFLLFMMCLVAFSSFTTNIYAEDVKSIIPSDPLTENIAKLKSDDVSIRRQAAETLGMLHNPAAIEPLRQIIKDKDPFVRTAVLDSLGLLRASSAVKDIVELLLKDTQGSVRQSAAVSLNYIADPVSVPYLIEALKDKNEGTQYAAVNALGTIRDPSSLPILIENLKNKNVNMRRSCIEAVGRFENNAAILPALRESMHDEDSTIRAKAASLCGNMLDKESEPIFKELLKDSDIKVRLNAVGALSKIDIKDGVDTALKCLTDADINLRIQAAEILGNFDGKKVTDALEKALNDTDAGVKQSAQISLIKIKARQPKSQPQIKSNRQVKPIQKQGQKPVKKQ